MGGDWRTFCGGLLAGALLGGCGLWRQSAPTPTHAHVSHATSDLGRRPRSLVPIATAAEGGPGAVQPAAVPTSRPFGAPEATPAETVSSTAISVSSSAAASVSAPTEDGPVHWRETAAAARRNGAYSSASRLKPLPESVDIALPGMAAHVAEHRSYRGEIIMFTSDAQMIGWAGHWVHQMRSFGYEHWMILADQPKTCGTLQSDWKPMVEKHGEAALSCVWSSYPREHPGWEQWKPKRFGPKGDSLHNVYILWSTRWWVSWMLLQQGVNVLSLDVDAVLLTDIYQLLRAPPLVHQDVLITRNSDASQSLNCGFVYFNRDAAKSRGDGARDARVCAANGRPALGGADSAGGVVAAEWVAQSMWERTKLFLEVDKSKLARPPVREVLWEQDVWNDLAKSIELGKRVFPWAVGYGKDSDLWEQLGYERSVQGGIKHTEKWVQWKEREAKHKGMTLPPWEPPREKNSEAFYEEDVRHPMLWVPACPPINASSSAEVRGVGLTGGVPLGIVSERPLLPGRLMIAPTWLASLGDEPQPDWAAANPPPFSYLHLTNMWHCFPHMCWSKAGRLFWLRAHGFWDSRLDELGMTPRGPPHTERTRALTLPRGTFDAVRALTPPHNGELPHVTARTRWLAYRRMHGLVHNLVTVASLLGRTPVIPKVPCEFVTAVQQRQGSTPSHRARFGVSHPSVIAVGDADNPTCHLAPGTWRPGGPDQCYHNLVMSDFDYDVFAKRHAFRPYNGSVLPIAETAPTPASAADAASAKIDLGPIRVMCAAAAKLGSSPSLELGGLLPIRDYLLDSPLDAAEFESEATRLKSGRPRWASQLGVKELRRLQDVCPGAQKLIEFRKACVGYFLAE